MTRLLLVNPKYNESFWSFKWAVDRILPDKRAINPPLGLATIAALCPADWKIEIVDENVESVPLHPQADIVGVCGMGIQFARQKELLAYYRNQGYYTVAGGSYASLCPENYAGQADTVISGEAEYIWPFFCRDFPAKAAQPLYRESGVVRSNIRPRPGSICSNWTSTQQPPCSSRADVPIGANSATSSSCSAASLDASRWRT